MRAHGAWRTLCFLCSGGCFKSGFPPNEIFIIKNLLIVYGTPWVRRGGDGDGEGIYIREVVCCNGVFLSSFLVCWKSVLKCVWISVLF